MRIDIRGDDVQVPAHIRQVIEKRARLARAAHRFVARGNRFERTSIRLADFGRTA